MKKDQRGFSMVELIVVIAIVGILMGASVSLIGHIRSANIQKAVETVSDMLDRQRINSMTKQGTHYLYIYRLDDGYYMKALSDKLITYNDGLLGTGGTKICSDAISVSMQNGAGSIETMQKKNQIIRIVFKKSGALNTDPDSGTTYDHIIFTGNGTYTIELYASTGKHAIQ